MRSLHRFYAKGRRIKFLFAAAWFTAPIALILGITLGSVPLDWGSVLTGADRLILLYVRLPRALACFVAGAALAVSGAVIQGVFANRLASPGIIGVNAGAGLAVTACAAMGVLGGWRLSLGAFLGAFLAALLVACGARKFGSSKATVILVGVALNSFFHAVSSMIEVLNPEILIMSQDFRIGDFSAVTYSKLIPATLIVLPTLAFLFCLSNELDILGLGEEGARGLGLHPGRTSVLFLLLAALLAGAAVSLAGLVSFVGLIVPHIIRRLGGFASAHLLPLCALLGGSYVTLCDLVARTLFSPYEIPVGIILSFIGAPFFVFLLLKRRGGGTS